MLDRGRVVSRLGKARGNLSHLHTIFIRLQFEDKEAYMLLLSRIN